jgi:hypothetical protein
VLLSEAAVTNESARDGLAKGYIGQVGKRNRKSDQTTKLTG